MPTFVFRGLLLAAFLCPIFGLAQMPGSSEAPGERVDSDIALDRALQASSLTVKGKPFHAVMDIGNTGTEYSGKIEVWWVNEAKFRLIIASPQFSQEKIVNAGHVFEKDKGDYYPRWLENFSLALLDPVSLTRNFRGRSGSVLLDGQSPCLQRDDRPGGITDQLTWGILCFSGSQPVITSLLTTNTSLQYTGWRSFGKKTIAHTYETSVLDFKPVQGVLTTLEELTKVDDGMFTVSETTPVDQQLATTFVSTLKGESLIEVTPIIDWPSVREGKTSGYMIVYARTDRTGQVRETAKHNSDQPGLETFGMEQALKYKFKPLFIDGVAQQMEMPLVLHFSSRLDDPLPVLTLDQMKKQMAGCETAEVPFGTATHIVKVSVNEAGKLTGETSMPDTKGSAPAMAIRSLSGCRFMPYRINGNATYYHGYVELLGR